MTGHDLPLKDRHEYWVTRWSRTSSEERTRDYRRLKVYRQGFRDKVLEHYGKRCVCCGETQDEFLTIDHVNGGGMKHRRDIGAHLPYMLYQVDH